MASVAGRAAAPYTARVLTRDAILLDLTRRYCEPHRVFHTLYHIADMLMRGRELALSEEQVLGIWYHDAIYDVRGRENEARSAALAVEQLTAAGRAPSFVEAVERIVLDTIRHEASSEASRIVMDLDLATLGGTWEAFSANTALIRAEFAHLDDAAFDEGQGKLFRSLLERDRIYATDWGRALEEQARANLTRALRAASLGGS